MHHSPVAILQNKRQQGRAYRANSLTHHGNNPQLGTSAGTPNSYGSSFIDHAFDHPTPTSFSQLQFLSSSLASNEGADYTHRVPRVEEKFCSGFNCCGRELDDLHHLLEHFEECHVLAGPPDPNNLPPPHTTATSVFDSAASSIAEGDVPQFDDFDEEEAAEQHHHPQMSQSGNGPTLSAPPSPALSSYSDHHPAGHPSTTINTSGPPFYKLKPKLRNNTTGSSNSQSSFQSSSSSFKKGKSRSPTSGGEDEVVGMTSEDENPSAQFSFTRKARQQSMDSIASISTNASNSSKKRSFIAAMGNSGIGGVLGTNNRPSGMNSTTTNSRSGGIDLYQIRGVTPSSISTPDSSVPGTPASDYGGQSTSEMMALGCMPPSLLFPSSSRDFHGGDGEEMTTDEEEEDSLHFGGYGMSDSMFETKDDEEHEYEDEEGDETAECGTTDSGTFSSPVSLMAGSAIGDSLINPRGPDRKRSKTSKKKNRNYDSQMDREAAAMFSPLSLLSSANGSHAAYKNNRGTGEGGNIAVPTISNSTSPSSQATASAATLAAIQAAAAANGLNTASTPTGRIWVPNNAKPYKCHVIGCDKAYKQQNGLKYHRLHGHCNANSNGQEGEDLSTNEEDKPFGCYVGSACGKKYKNMNGLRYHYQHSGAHGQIGLQMLSNGTHPPPAYPLGHKRPTTTKASTYSEFSNTASPTVVMNQSTAEALLVAISNSTPAANTTAGSSPSQTTPNSSNSSSRNNSRPSTPRIGTLSDAESGSNNTIRNGTTSPSSLNSTRQRTSPQRQHQHSQAIFPNLAISLGAE